MDQLTNAGAVRIELDDARGYEVDTQLRGRGHAAPYDISLGEEAWEI